MKRCTKCKRGLSLDEFGKDKGTKDGLYSWCKSCISKTQRARLERKNPDAKKLLSFSQKHRIIGSVKQKLCTYCDIWQPLDEFCKNRVAKDGLDCWCKNCNQKYRQAHETEGVEYRQTHKIEIAGYNKKYRRTHKIEIAGYNKKYQKTFRGRLYHIFDAMKQRCSNPKNSRYKDYGGRGIKIRYTFPEFYHYIVFTLGYDTIDKLKGLQVDRIDTKGHYELENIRIVTPNQNNMNTRKRRTWHGRSCSSRFKGVNWYKNYEKWRTQITANGKHHSLGYFTDEIAAAEAYDQASLKYHGEFGATNRSLGLFN